MLKLHLLYGLAWLVFGALHSVLASHKAKVALSGLMSASYRFWYNAFAAIHIMATFAFGRWLYSGAPVLVSSDSVELALSALYVTGFIIMAAALFQYDLGAFSGSKPWFNRNKKTSNEDIEPLNTSGFHQYVRHPLYTGAFMILWGGSSSYFGLATAILGSLYLVIGTYYEERRLIAVYGDAYQRYKNVVPAFAPWKGNALKKA